MHLPEFSLRISCFGCFRRVFSVRVRVGQREVAEGEAKAVTQSLLNSFDDGISLSAVRTFVIAVFDEHDGRVYWPLNMIVLESIGRSEF